MSDVSAATLISYFRLEDPKIPYTYSGWLKGSEGGPVLWLNLSAPCSQITDYAEADHLARVGLDFVGDGTALAAANAAGWQYVVGTPLFGRDVQMHGGTAKIEMILVGSGAKCQGYFAASYP